jgi:glycyl-tRNA synthetase
MSEDLMDKIVSLCKRRGFIFQSSEIYGGINALYDYGPMGVELKNNIKATWWKHMVQMRDDIVGIDCSIIMHPRTWQASGHLESFTDPLVDCLGECKQRWRADQLDTMQCPACGGPLSEVRQFNLMFKTYVGPVEEKSAEVYLRPETAQGIFVNFKNVLNTSRMRIPFGIAQIGKAFRNEISPGNFIFRSREFEQMECEYFIKPGTEDQWFEYWLEHRMAWYVKALGIKPEHLRFREHTQDELAHYAKRACDIEYLFPFGWQELEGIASRSDYDLRRHQDFSGEDLTYYDDIARERFIPYVIEPSAGVDRTFLCVLLDSYSEDMAPSAKGGEEPRVVLKLPKNLAPVQVAVLPLSKREELCRGASMIASMLRKHFRVEYDETQSIGRRYRRQDEIGTPYAVTFDFQSIEDNCVTIRERDTMSQIRVPISQLVQKLTELFDEE